MAKEKFENKYRIQSARLNGWDYSDAGWYFITIRTQDRFNYFGEIENGEIQLSKIGEMAKQYWLAIPQHFPSVKLDEFIIMPNHVHGILIINNVTGVGTGRDLSLPRQTKSLSELIGAFKTTSSKLIHRFGLVEFQWQRSFYDHIIRNEKSLNNIRQYIIDNPRKWGWDGNNLN